MHWRRKWQPTPVFLPGESQGRGGSLVGCRLWGRTESDHPCLLSLAIQLPQLLPEALLPGPLNRKVQGSRAEPGRASCGGRCEGGGHTAQTRGVYYHRNPCPQPGSAQTGPVPWTQEAVQLAGGLSFVRRVWNAGSPGALPPIPQNLHRPPTQPLPQLHCDVQGPSVG